MNIKKLARRMPWLSRLLLYAYNRWRVGDRVRFFRSSRISHRSEFEGLNMVGRGSSYHGHMGLGSYIGGNTHLNADIGRFSSVANGVTCVNATHPMREPFATTCPLFYSLEHSKNPEHVTFAQRQMAVEFRTIDEERGIDVSIGNDVWIGQEATILGGVKLSDGVVVLANAWVVKDVPPYAIVGGTPAKVIGYRYDEETVKFLLATRWWENSREWLEEHWELLCDMERLKQYYRERGSGASSSSS